MNLDLIRQDFPPLRGSKPPIYFDTACQSRTFYARTETHYFDLPEDWVLMFDDDVLAITTLTNGNGAVIGPTLYDFMPKNYSPYYGIQLKYKGSQTVYWLPDSNGNTQKVISVAGKWGYVDRTAIDTGSLTVISNTRRACIDIVRMWYRGRTGDNQGGNAIVTAAGVVQTPAGAMPRSAWEAIKAYTGHAG